MEALHPRLSVKTGPAGTVATHPQHRIQSPLMWVVLGALGCSRLDRVIGTSRNSERCPVSELACHLPPGNPNRIKILIDSQQR